MILELFLLILGLGMLVRGADFFVDSASAIAKKLGISEFVIGLTLVAIGTSIPELASSIAAALKGSSEIIIGNIVGSNITNIGLIVGVAASITIIKVDKEMLSRDGYIMLFATFLFYFFGIGGFISRTQSTIFLVIYFLYIIILLSRKHKFNFKKMIDHPFNMLFLKKKNGKYIFKYAMNEKKLKKFDKLLLKNLGIFFISGGAVIYGANLLINNAIYFANLLKISETVIGLTLIALGTSLPELTVTISAARKGHVNIAIGNVIGSNIANILLVLGISGFLFPLQVQEATLKLSGSFMLFISILLLFFIRTEWKIRRWEGIILLMLYLLFVIASFFFL